MVGRCNFLLGPDLFLGAKNLLVSGSVYPKLSMYGIFTYICHKNKPNVTIYLPIFTPYIYHIFAINIPYMEPLGMIHEASESDSFRLSRSPMLQVVLTCRGPRVVMA